MGQKQHLWGMGQVSHSHAVKTISPGLLGEVTHLSQFL